MVNFRYHIVSLIAVFVALCLGVVLGAGPLQSRISSGLTPTTSTASSNEALAQAQNNSKIEARAVAELAQGRLAGSLNGVSVAIVTVPGSDSSDVASMLDTLGTAGAQVVGEVELTNTWLSADSATFRNTLATPLASHLTGLAGDAGAEAVIGQAIVTSLTQSGSEPDLVKQILTGGDTPVMRMTKDPQGGAQAIVVVAPRGNTSANTQTADPSSLASQASWEGLAKTIGNAPAGGLILGDASTDRSTLTALRRGNVPATTVDQVGTTQGTISAVLALKDAHSSARSFGVGSGASAIFPPAQ